MNRKQLDEIEYDVSQGKYTAESLYTLLAQVCQTNRNQVKELESKLIELEKGWGILLKAVESAESKIEKIRALKVISRPNWTDVLLKSEVQEILGDKPNEL